MPRFRFYRGTAPATTSAYARRTSGGPKRNARDGSWTCLGPFDWQLGLQQENGSWFGLGFNAMIGLVKVGFFRKLLIFSPKDSQKGLKMECRLIIECWGCEPRIATCVTTVEQKNLRVYTAIPIHRLITHPLPSPHSFRDAANQFQILCFCPLQYIIMYASFIVELKKKHGSRCCHVI